MRKISLVILILLISSTSMAQIPEMISFQGYMESRAGQILNGDYDMTFSLYDSAAGPNPALWSEVQTVTVEDSIFSVMLGAVVAFNLTFDEPYWLGIKVENDSEMTPRIEFGSAPYALNTNSWRLDGNTGTTAGTDFLGTTDNEPLELHVDNQRALRLEPDAVSPNIVGGYFDNSVLTGVHGATISGGGFAGKQNQIFDLFGTIAGGTGNSAGINDGDTGLQAYGTIGGGGNNAVSGFAATIGGGVNNTANGAGSTIAGGPQNTASGENSTVGGGSGNTASQFESTVSGGGGNNATGVQSTISGGLDNTADGRYSMIPGGRQNTANGWASFAAGNRAKANGDGCFVWGDNTDADIGCSTDQQWVARASGGVFFYTNASGTSGMFLSPNGSSWNAVSDREMKENFKPVDSEILLTRLAEIPVTTWNYKAQDRSIRHIGPSAQDFNRLVDGLGGEGEKYINSLDANGVALAAIKGLNDKLKEKEARIQELEKRLARLETKIVDIIEVSITSN